MKPGSALLLSSLLVTSPLAAETFNNRGILWEKAAPIGTYQARGAVKPDLSGFNQRSVHWVVEAPAGSSRPRAAIQARPEAYQRR